MHLLVYLSLALIAVIPDYWPLAKCIAYSCLAIAVGTELIVHMVQRKS